MHRSGQGVFIPLDRHVQEKQLILCNFHCELDLLTQAMQVVYEGRSSLEDGTFVVKHLAFSD